MQSLYALLPGISWHFDASGWSTFPRVVFEVWSLGTMGGWHAATRLKAGGDIEGHMRTE